MAVTLTFRILVGGRTGAGKSTLVNHLLLSSVCEVGSGSRSITTSVRKVTKTIRGIEFNIFDTPGLSDRREGQDSKTVLTEIARVKSDLMEIIICYVFANRLYPAPQNWQDEEEIGLLTRAFGKEIWKRSIIVLTCANTSIVSDKETCDEAIEKYKTDLKAKINSGIVDDIPVCLAGYKDDDVPFSNLQYRHELAKQTLHYCT